MKIAPAVKKNRFLVLPFLRYAIISRLSGILQQLMKSCNWQLTKHQSNAQNDSVLCVLSMSHVYAAQNNTAQCLRQRRVTVICCCLLCIKLQNSCDIRDATATKQAPKIARWSLTTWSNGRRRPNCMPSSNCPFLPRVACRHVKIVTINRLCYGCNQIRRVNRLNDENNTL